MFCRNCGEENIEEAIFCKNCGTQLREEPKKAEILEPTEYQSTDSGSNNTLCCCLFIIVIFLIFAIL